MYAGVRDVPPVAYEDPWQQDLRDRLAALRPRTFRVLYHYTSPDNSTFRYRVYNVAQAMRGSAACSVSWFSAAELGHAEEFVGRCDLLVLCRVRYSAAVDTLIGLARRRGVPVVFDCDDLVFDTRYVHMVMDSLNCSSADEASLDSWYAYIGRMERTLRCCDGAFATNRFLADRAEDLAQIPVRVLPNFLNQEQLGLSDALVAAKNAAGWQRDGSFLIGYFSGSPSHERDFAIVAEELAELLARRPEARLRLVGFLGHQSCLNRVRAQVEVLPFMDFINLQAAIAPCEVALAPLQGNIFTRCKSDLKYFESAVVGTALIASPTPAFREAIDPGATGWLAFAQDWRGLLEQLASDPALAVTAARQAQETARRRYAPDAMVPTILDAFSLGGAANGRARTAHARAT